MNRWALTLASLAGEPWPLPPALPGRRHECADAPLADDELADITSPSELALLLGISRQAASVRLKQRANPRGALELLQASRDTEPGTRLHRKPVTLPPFSRRARARLQLTSHVATPTPAGGATDTERRH